MTDEQTNIVAYLNFLGHELSKIMHPQGEEDSPYARSCLDLRMENNDLTNGLYWIDPDGGVPNNKIQVYCDFRKKTYTCVRPLIGLYENQPVSKEEGDDYALFAQKQIKGKELEYQSNRVQLKVLQKMSSKAIQTIVYKCRNTVAYYDRQADAYNKAIKLVTFDDTDLGAQGRKKYRYKVISDGCDMAQDSWGETVVEVSTKKTERLPIIDVGIQDIGQPNQEFKIEVGPVCFSHDN